MKKNIFRSIFLVAIGIFFFSIILIMGALYSYFSDVQIDNLKKQTELAAIGAEYEGTAYFDSIETKDFRITLIKQDGTVIYDTQSSADSMENHLDRTEVRQAINNGTGESSRYSATLLERQIYCAKLLSDGSVIRLSENHYSIISLLIIMNQHIVVILIIAVFMSLIFASRLSARIVHPLNKMDLDNPEIKEDYEELKPLIDRLVSQQCQLKAQSAELRKKQEEFYAATVNMNEGLVLLNESGTILSINQTASNLLSASRYCIGKDILLVNNSLELQELLEKAQNGEHSGILMNLNGMNYQINASPVISDGAVTGIALIIFDITEKEKAEKSRREFSANVSHELKTPLHSISGYAELMKNGMVMEKDVAGFSERIFSEAQRMISLVDDIIRLSKLDEGLADTQMEDIDLYKLAQETTASLMPAAEKAGVTITLTGESAEMKGYPQLLTGIIHNLCDNAVKYNRKDGSVDVDIKKNENDIILTVSDNGIGIAPEHQERIFERFYQVDKSHSKEVGGTGLGLSIVKHAVKIHDADITLQSISDGGTTISVIFPC